MIVNQQHKLSRLDQCAEQYVYDLAALIPTQATDWGIPGHDDALQDFSPEFYESVSQRTQQMLRDVDTFESDGDEITAAVMRDRLGIAVELWQRGENLRNLNTIDSPVQHIRDSLLQMPTGDAMRGRLGKVPQALAGYRESLALAANLGDIAARRQIIELLSQIDDLTNGTILDKLFDAPVPEIPQAKQAFAELAAWLQEELLPRAPEADGFGRDRYELFSREFTGAKIDLDEAYNWGQEQLAKIIAQQQECAKELYGLGVSVTEACKRLDQEERYTLHGVDNLTAWMQNIADTAVDELSGKHFKIPDVMRTIECCIDPAGTGGIFYTPPTDDFSRPGRMWWSVPPGEDKFHTWKELTTVYHEGVPGHHLQLGLAICQRDKLNLWRRIACWNSGHGEGWALYAEALMKELGYFDDPGYRMGFYDAQRLRAARVVLDIGVHLGKKTSDGGEWTFKYAYRFLRNHVAMSDANLHFELHRYFGWPGQAPSYALGQRLWQELRADALQTGQTAREFHAIALAEGSIPMSILRDVVLKQDNGV